MELTFRSLVTVFMVLLALSFPALANENAKIKDIRTLLKLSNAENIGLQMAHAVSQSVFDAIQKSSSAKVPPRAIEIVKDEMANLLNSEFSSLMNTMIKIYDDNFSHSEIKDLTTFYRTPTGRKTVALMPSIMQKSLSAGQSWSKKLIPKFQEAILSRFREEGLIKTEE
jgi:uncharacterized protein